MFGKVQDQPAFATLRLATDPGKDPLRDAK